MRYRAHLVLLVAIGAFQLAGCVTTGPVEDDGKALKAAKANTDLGRQYLERGQTEIALEKLKRAIAHDKTYSPAHTVLAFLYEQIDEDKLAGEEYRAAIKYDPEDGSVNNNYGAFLCAHGRADEAQQYFDTALADHFYQTPELALSNAGVCQLGEGNLDKAEKFLRQSIEYDENLAASLFALAQLNYQRGEYLKARAFLQRFESVAKHTEESLSLGYNIERELGDDKAAQAYKEELAQKNPKSIPENN